MEFGSKFVYLGNDVEDEEEVTVSNVGDMVVSDSDSDGAAHDDGEVCLLDILDTCGQEEYSSVRDLYVRTGDGFVIIYSITDKNSFTEAEAIFKWLKRIKQVDPVAVLVANKQDLSSEVTVTTQEGQSLARNLGIPFYETSAKTGTGIVEMMTGLVKIIPRSSTNYKIAMLGSGAVGKSSISIRFVSNIFVEDYDPTIEDSYRKMIKVKGLKQLSKNEKKALQAKKKAQMKQGSSSSHALPQAVSQAGCHRLTGTRFRSHPRTNQCMSMALQEDKFFEHSENIIEMDIESDDTLEKTSPTDNVIDQIKTVTMKKTDGNVLLIPLRTLGEEPQMVTGDPIKCGCCSAVLTSTAVLESVGETKTWKCEFCEHKNTGLDLSEDEVPKGDCFDFMLSPPTKPKVDTHDTEQGATSEAKKEETPGVIVYCMDCSSSMSSLCQIPESQAVWREERTHGRESVSNVTRLSCIKNAVERLTEQLNMEEPKKQVLLTVFGSEVYVKAGGRTENLPSFLNVANMTFDELLTLGLNLSSDYSLKTIEESYESVKHAIRGLSDSGTTALGPALSICAGYVSKLPGSEIVLCTDGMPNVGIGSLGSTGQGGAFYRMIGDYARSKNITINILAVGEDSVGLQHVSAAAENSGGVTNRLNPMEVVRQLRLIAQNEVIATSVSVRFYLHPDFVFDEPGYDNNLSRLEKEVGTVRKETDLSFRFKLKNSSHDKSLSSVPFQVQITYTRKDGARFLRVLSKSTPTTTSRKDMEENISVSVLGVSAMRATSKMAQSGMPTQAQHMLKNVKRMIKRGAHLEEQMEEKLAFENEAQALDNQLFERSSELRSRQLDDSLYNCVQQAGHMNYMMQAAVGKKMDIIQNRKMNKRAKDVYYDYKEKF